MAVLRNATKRFPVSADLIVRSALVIVGVVAVVTLLRPDIHNTGVLFLSRPSFCTHPLCFLSSLCAADTRF